MPTLERFPISFKTYFSGNYFRHIVLGVNLGGRYGALGMSRREDLMYKPPAFRTLSELVLDYEAAYGRCWHVLKKVKLGQCVSHDPHSVEQIEWKHSVLDVEKLGRDDFRKELERHARDMRLKVRKGAALPAPPCSHPRPSPAEVGSMRERTVCGGYVSSVVLLSSCPLGGQAKDSSGREGVTRVGRW